MQETETVILAVTEMHRLCECIEPAIEHNPGKCQGAGEQTCQTCGRQCCDDCYVFSRKLCMTCHFGGTQ